MNDDWTNADEEDIHSYEGFRETVGDESLENYEANVNIISDKLKLLFQKAQQYRSAGRQSTDTHDRLLNSVLSFIVNNVRTVDYRDLAKLAGIKQEMVKDALVRSGVKIPDDSVRRWKDIYVGTFKSISDCVKCQIQLNHRTFCVGINNCRKCYEENLKHWVEAGETINISIPEK